MIADTGWWIALERSDRRAWAQLEVLRRNGSIVITSAGVVAQVWRGGSRQARLSIALRTAEVIDLTGSVARDVGILIADTDGQDVVDGHVALLARQHPARPVATSDRADLERLGVTADRIIDA